MPVLISQSFVVLDPEIEEAVEVDQRKAKSRLPASSLVQVRGDDDGRRLRVVT
jgi:hypothetical protein